MWTLVILYESNLYPFSPSKTISRLLKKEIHENNASASISILQENNPIGLLVKQCISFHINPRAFCLIYQLSHGAISASQYKRRKNIKIWNFSMKSKGEYFFHIFFLDFFFACGGQAREVYD
jgi:hypothetical protein